MILLRPRIGLPAPLPIRCRLVGGRTQQGLRLGSGGSGGECGPGPGSPHWGFLAYAPDWAETAGTGSFHGAPVDIAASPHSLGCRRALQTAGSMDWEIWNEPNNDAFWAPRADPGDLHRSAAAELPTIKVVQLAPRCSPGAVAGRERFGGDTGTPDLPGADVRRGSRRQLRRGSPSTRTPFPAMPTDPATAGWNTFQKMPGLHDLDGRAR